MPNIIPQDISWCRKLSLGVTIFALLVSTTPALAAGQCYLSEQMQAEQLLRLHSELMVITVTCRQSSTGQNLVPAYTSFTHTNMTAIQRAEATLVHYFESGKKGSGTTLLDKLRTKLGNEYGQKIANMSAPEFCQQYRDKVTALSVADAHQIDDEVNHMVKTEHAYGELCPSIAPQPASPSATTH